LAVHLSYAQIPIRTGGEMNLKDVFQLVSPAVRDAAVRTAEQLKRLGIRHALAGGLAVGAHGYVRTTSDVDFLVGEEAFEHHGAIVAFRPGVPIEVEGIRIDYLSPVALGSQVEDALNHPLTSEGLAVVPANTLVFMKLKARRRRDLVDVVELVRAGMDVKPVREYLAQHAPELVKLFDELCDEASRQDV
jgi:hypothetical protein